VLVNQGGRGCCCAPCGHQLPQAGPGIGGEVVSGVPQIVKVDAGQPRGLKGREPDPSPEVSPAQGRPGRAREDQVLLAGGGEA
jgi:hypothetical protein